jgi:hypothetical protein
LNIIEWAAKHRVSPEALRELCESALYIQPDVDGASEARVQSEIRLAAARAGRYLFRNNRGAGKTDTGSYVRYGLANDSKKLGDEFKSGDLIGWEQVLITDDHVGTFIARFLSVEAKRRDWKFSGTLEEIAQAKWAALVNAQGGRAVITNTPEGV